MNISIVLVLILNVLGTHSHCGFGCQFWRVVSILEDASEEDVDNCYCVRTYQCYQEDISTHLECRNTFYDYIDPDYVCCRRPVRFTTVRPPPRGPTQFTKRWHWSNRRNPTKKPSQRTQPTTESPSKTSTKITSRIPSSQLTTQGSSQTSTQIPITSPPTQIGPSSSQSQLHDTSQDSHSTSTDCTCMTPSECHDEEFESVSKHEKESCQIPTHVCCFGLVQQVTQPKPQKLKPPQSTSPTTIHTQDQTFNSTLQTQTGRPKPSPISPPTDKNCTCIPFYKCYDEETSSNLTGLVNDRLITTNLSGVENDKTSIPIVEEGCSDPNDVCCHNLVKITAKPTVEPSFEDCTGSCISIKECPYLLSKLKKTQNGTLDAVQELRRSVCSSKNGVLRVCCPINGSPPCQFPFLYKGVTYSDCTSIDDPDREPWCSTQTDSKTNHVNDQWRHCTPNEALRE